MIELMMKYAFQFIGLPYRWGGDDPIHGFDCSGFVQEVLASIGMDPPGDQTAQALFDHFQVSGILNRRTAGALVFYGKSTKQIDHVAMFIDARIIIEAGGGGSKTLTEANAAEQNAFIRLRPYDRRKDIVAVVMPRYP